jgi:hypothetical protein
VPAEFLDLPSDRRGTAGDLGLVPAHAEHQRRAADHGRGVAAGLLARLADPAEQADVLLGGQERHVELAGVPRGQPRRALRARAADEDRDAALLDRLGQCRGTGEPVVPAGEVERLPGRGAPQPGDDGQLLLVAVEAFAERGERDAVGGVLVGEPARADAQLHPAAAHLVDLRDRDGQRAGEPEGTGRHQGPQSDPAGLAGEPGEGDPGVGRAGESVAAHGQVVVGPEEGVEAGLLGAPRDGEQVVVGGAHLGLGEDA